MNGVKRNPINQAAKQLGDRVRCLRSLLHLTQREMGKKLGSGYDTVTRIEVGVTVTISLEVLARLARLGLENNVAVEWLLLGSGQMDNRR